MLRAAAAKARTVEVMDHAEALPLLPEAYARALTLRAGGASPADIARDLDIVVEAVPSLLRLADAKLARLLAEGPGPSDADRPAPFGPAGGAEPARWAACPLARCGGP